MLFDDHGARTVSRIGKSLKIGAFYGGKGHTRKRDVESTSIIKAPDVFDPLPQVSTTVWLGLGNAGIVFQDNTKHPVLAGVFPVNRRVM